MNTEEFRTYCLSLPQVTEDMPFDDTVLTFRIKGKIFAAIILDKPELVVMKCDPERAQRLRERYPSIEGAWHWNRKYWNQIRCDREVGDDLLRELADHAYEEVWKKLPKKLREDSGKN